MATKALHPATPHARAELRGTARHIALAVIGGALLIGFAVIVVREVLATVGAVTPAHDDSYELFAVSLTGLAGGAFAAGVRADQTAPRSPAGSRERDDRWRGAIMSAFVAVYVAAGAMALVVCLVCLGGSTSVLRGLAATFLGTSVATLTIFLDVPTTSGEEG
jgi:hypothetical protein